MKIVIIAFIIILFSEASLSLQDNSPSEKFKREAITSMSQGRYGEAIDLLNKFISENPQNYEGYFLRGECYEARGQYELAVYDLRSASKLNRKDIEVSKALARVTEVWYTQLYNKIEGHKREITIYPNDARNYLEIGKSYKNLGNWNEAEEWYDKYLAMEEPSADEVIRYSEILAKTGHITKGEKILKKFVEKYPEDHRLWSRYGYFTLWLRKNKIAISAFTEALNFRPFFKEAIDGLNLAKGKGAVYSVNDTSYRYDKRTGTFQRKGGKEYFIDRYFRILRKNPSNDSIRIVLINELLKVNRIEEAKQQLSRSDRNKIGDAQFIALENEIDTKWNDYLNNEINRLKERIKTNPNDRKAIRELANRYTLLNKIDSVDYVLSAYLASNPNDAEIGYDLAKKLSWFKEFDKARKHADTLLSLKPDKPEYQLLRAQISVWTNTEPELANSLLNNILEKEPNNIQALISLATLKYQIQKFTDAESIIAKLERIDSKNPDIDEFKYNLFVQKKQFEENTGFELLQKARNALNEKKCSEAIGFYKEYLSQYNFDDKVRLELANAYICSNDYRDAISIYTNTLDSNFDFDLAKQRAKLYFWSEDSLNALREFKVLSSLNPNDVEVKLFLGDSYFKVNDYLNARKIYRELLAQSPSSKLLETRMSWLPTDEVTDGTFASFISNFPIYTLITPEADYFKDNLSFIYNLQGLRLELGATKFLSIGGSIFRGDVASDTSKLNFYNVTGDLIIFPSKLITASLSFGQTKYQNNRKQSIADFSLKSEVKNLYTLVGRYRLSDAAQSLYSPFIIDTSLNVVDYSVEGAYFTPTDMILSGSYSAKKISDGNVGKELVLRLGRKFSIDFTAGYEYYNLKYNFESPLYYSPPNFESHSLWAEYNIFKDKIMDLSIGGKLGVVPDIDYLVKEFNSRLGLKIFEPFILQAQAVLGENVREEVSYRSTSISVMAFWVF